MKDHHPLHGLDVRAGDTVTVTLKGEAGSYTSAPPVPGSPGMTLLIAPGEFARHLGADVSVFYTRWRNGVSTDSDILSLQVGDIRDNDLRVAPPVFAEANGSFVLDLNTFAGDATIEVTAWPLMAKGQRYWLSAGSWDIVSQETVQMSGDFAVTLKRELLNTVAEGSPIAIHLGVAFGSDSDDRTSFTSQTYTVLAAYPPLSFGFNQTLKMANYHVVEGRPPRVPPADATYTQRATGGKSPYVYTSANPLIATVDADGKVRACGNGSADIVATDARGATARHGVSVSGARVFRHVTLSSHIDAAKRATHDGVQQLCSEGGWVFPQLVEIKKLLIVYQAERPIATGLGWAVESASTANYWSFDFHGPNQAWIINLNSSSINDGFATALGTRAFVIVMLTPR